MLENIRQQVSPRWNALISEVRSHPDIDLASFLEESGRELADILRNGRSWTTRYAVTPAAWTPRPAIERVIWSNVSAPSRTSTTGFAATNTSGSFAPPSKPAAPRVPAGGHVVLLAVPGRRGIRERRRRALGNRDQPVFDELRQVVDIGFNAAHRPTTRLVICCRCSPRSPRRPRQLLA